ncbi:uncharacterized protein LOC130506891 [Raphanus sativus]|uniref:Uncharacterized protein LOC130499494 n=1 Tax=Raphanus sativus TaxID=3726 RepID=A0A9W3CDM4_RAPSA|nr:uncharacterized protein LOC130499494 [Raphanus sativus]XP_056857565.1 uncharacterized protein LOC130506891 [Raphanus sativus]
MEPWSDVNVEWNDVPAFDPGTPDSPDIDSDGEDRRERNDYNIEKDAMNFVDEPPVKHNLYPETESDEEADVEENQRKEVQRTIYRRDQFRRGSGELFVGQVFINGIAFKEAVLDYALKTGRNIKQNRYDSTKIGFVCEGKGCSWRVYASVAAKYPNKWQVKIMKKDHTCVPTGTCEMLKVPQIARLFVDKIREEPEYFMPMKMEELVMEKWKINVSRPQCQHARNKAVRWIAREYDEQFGRLNNSTESFNNSIGKARDKPFVPMLETIARLAMVRIAKRDVICSSYEGICTPYVVEMLEKLHQKASESTIRPSTNQTYECTTSYGCAHRVNLESRTCSCRRWEITGIPCEHAYGVMLKKGLEAQDYVVHWFKTPTWRRTYAEGIVPLRGAKFWPVGEEPSIIEPVIPDQPGRKKVTKADKKRKRGVNESPSKKKDKTLKRIMHCGQCGAANHNIRFHKNKTFVSGESSQPEASQGVCTQGSQSRK